MKHAFSGSIRMYLSGNNFAAILEKQDVPTPPLGVCTHGKAIQPVGDEKSVINIHPLESTIGDPSREIRGRTLNTQRKREKDEGR